MQVSTPLGKVGILPRGDYSPTATYNRNDLVTTEVGTYCCMSLEPITGVPTTNTDAWL